MSSMTITRGSQVRFDEARSEADSEQEAILAAMKQAVNSCAAPHAGASLLTGIMVLAVWCLALGVGWAAFDFTRNVRGAELFGQLMYVPVRLLWVASAIGLIEGVLALMQPYGKIAFAVWGILVNGLFCVGPLVAILALVR